MEHALRQVEEAFRILDIDPWSDDVKVSERVIPAVFNNYYRRLGIKNEMSKADFHSLVEYNDLSRIDHEVAEVLDRMLEVIQRAKPAE